MRSGFIYDIRNITTIEEDGVSVDRNFPSCLSESNFRIIPGSKGDLKVFVNKCGSEDGKFVCDAKFCCQDGFTVCLVLLPE